MIRGVKFEQEKLEQELLNSKPYLLYPGNDSLDCQAISLGQENTVVVIDGTWSEAGKIVFRNPFLQTLPRISFKTTLESNYQIRKQPKAGYLSTIESIAHLLKLNALAAGQVEKASSYQALFDVFDRMVDRQIRYFPRNRGKFISCS